jgi:hypothetical protein
VKVLIACEFSGIVRDAFSTCGHEAWSCDLLPAETEGNHYQGDVRDVIDTGWDLMIAHPPCNHLSVSGARWFQAKRQEQAHALGFVMQLWGSPIPCIALENPIGILSTHWRRPSQIIQPWQFGHGECKATCLWLKGLRTLVPTDVVEGRAERIANMCDSIGRAQRRSKTLPGIAHAMAAQWGARASVQYELQLTG